MTSDSATPNEAIDERLAQLRDSLLIEGETVTAQAEGDHGQAIVLTGSRVLVLKAGLTATGTPDGSVVGQFPYDQIKEINVRKGPLGEVIQIVAVDVQAPSQPGPPSNVVVFTGSDKAKRCDAIAVAVGEALGKPVGRIPDDLVKAEPKARVAAPDVVETVEAEEPAVEAVEAVKAEEPAAEMAAEKPAAEVAEAVTAEETAAEVVEAPKRKRGGRQARSLADEMFAELTGKEPPVQEPEPAEQAAVVEEKPAVEPEPIFVAEETSETPAQSDPSVGYAPNPNLPKPTRRTSGAGARMLVLLGLLMSALLVGVAVTQPLRHPEKQPRIIVDVAGLTSSPLVIRQRLKEISEFERSINTRLEPCNAILASFESALTSGNKASLCQMGCDRAVDDAWRDLRSMKTPAGLAGPKETIVSGLFTIKTAATRHVTSVQAGGNVSVAETMRSLNQGKAAVKAGLASMARTRASLEAQLQQKKPGSTAESVPKG